MEMVDWLLELFMHVIYFFPIYFIPKQNELNRKAPCPSSLPLSNRPFLNKGGDNSNYNVELRLKLVKKGKFIDMPSNQEFKSCHC